MNDWRVGEIYNGPGLGLWRVLAITPAGVVGRELIPGPLVTLENAALGYVMVKRTDDPDLQKLERIDG